MSGLPTHTGSTKEVTGMEPKEFKRQLDQLWQIIVDGVRYFAAWRSLMVEDKSSARGLNRYRDFFVPSRKALSKMAVLEFSSVFDPDQDRELHEPAQRGNKKPKPHPECD